MYAKSLLLAAAVASGVSAVALEPGRFSCGAPEPTTEQLQISQAFAIQEAQAARNGTLVERATINVDVYFHVLASSTSASDGYISDSALSQQLSVMNSNFAPQGIAFTLKGTDKTVNSAWASDQQELAMKKALKKGTYRTLNVYFMKSLGGNLGYCYFPTASGSTSGSNDWFYDGCSILFSTVPGGSATNFNQGKTVTHEVGHWFGLYHTFQGGCSGSGDSVSDTPAQASATSGCPTGRDSCPSQSGLDPINNYMDYSYDSCYTNFTPGQQTRMYSFWNSYRANK